LPPPALLIQTAPDVPPASPLARDARRPRGGVRRLAGARGGPHLRQSRGERARSRAHARRPERVDRRRSRAGGVPRHPGSRRQPSPGSGFQTAPIPCRRGSLAGSRTRADPPMRRRLFLQGERRRRLQVGRQRTSRAASALPTPQSPPLISAASAAAECAVSTIDASSAAPANAASEGRRRRAGSVPVELLVA
jgi:hypothetical protein